MTKEILKDEILTENELEQIAGGNRDELALDTQLFNAMGGRIKAYDLEDITNTNFRGIAAKVGPLWQKFGITMKYNDTGASNYYVDGKWTPRNEAIKTVLFRAGYHDINPDQFMIK